MNKDGKMWNKMTEDDDFTLEAGPLAGCCCEGPSGDIGLLSLSPHPSLWLCNMFRNGIVKVSDPEERCGLNMLRSWWCSERAIPENREMKKKWNSVLFCQRHALSRSFDIFVVTFRVTNFCQNSLTCYYFLWIKTEFPFFEFHYFPVEHLLAL